MAFTSLHWMATSSIGQKQLVKTVIDSKNSQIVFTPRIL